MGSAIIPVTLEDYRSSWICASWIELANGKYIINPLKIGSVEDCRSVMKSTPDPALSYRGESSVKCSGVTLVTVKEYMDAKWADDKAEGRRVDRN